MENIKDGVSVIICCFNSSWVIEKTLEGLLNQKNINSIDYEIIVVDNCSNDNTDRLVKSVFETYPEIQTKLIYESQPGLIFARNSGIEASRYSYLLFCDDDNILCENYVETAYSILSTNDRIAACGGYGIPYFFNCSKPIWFDEYKKAYATGKQKPDQRYLYGAGCCFNKRALSNLFSFNYKPLLTGRKKTALLAGDDSELTKALISIGYSLCPLDNIYFYHILTSKRLTKQYLINMHIGFGKAALVLDVYDQIIKKKTFSKYVYLSFFIRDVFKTCLWCIFRLKGGLRSQVAYKFYLGKLSSYNLFSFSMLYKQYELLYEAGKEK